MFAVLSWFCLLMSRRWRAVACAALLASVALVGAQPRSAVAAPSTVYFPETGHNLSDYFLGYWRTNGPLPIYGYPLTEPLQRDGLTVQYFERARFELHTAADGTPFVQLSLLGSQAIAGRSGSPFVRFGGDPARNTSDRTYFPPTGHYLAYGFKSFWEGHGDLANFGYPMSEEFQEKNADDGKTYTVQYFERARFEYHPEFSGTPNVVELGRLGAAAAQRDGIGTGPVARAAGAPDYDPILFAPQQRSLHVPVLMYHQFNDPASRYVTPLWTFDAELDWLVANGYQSVTITQLYDYMFNGGSLPANPVVITFDDGTAGQWTAAAHLEARGFHGVFFIPTGFSQLSVGQIRALSDRGHEVEAHSVTHPFLTRLGDGTLYWELQQSKTWLESVTGKPVNFFAYPFGDYNNHVIGAVADVGYQGGIAAWGGEDWTPGKQWNEPRVEISGLLSLAQFAALVRQ